MEYIVLVDFSILSSEVLIKLGKPAGFAGT